MTKWVAAAWISPVSSLRHS